jgi:prevent-host-death family protein
VGAVSVKEARRRFSDLVKAAERGESTLVTRRGRPVARLGPVGGRSLRGLPDLSAFRASVRLRRGSLTESLLASRREERS